MKKPISNIIILMHLLAITVPSFSEMYTWTDKGHTYYSDEVPPEYEHIAKPVKNIPLNTPAPEPEIRELNRKAVAALHEEDKKDKKDAEVKKQARLEKEREHQRLIEAQRDATRLAENSTSQSKYVSREDCRNIYKSVKERMRCYKVADKTRKHFIEHHGLSAPENHKTPRKPQRPMF